MKFFVTRWLCFGIAFMGIHSASAQWKAVQAPSMQANLSSTCSVNDSTGYMLGAVNTEPALTVILKTTDGGSTWDSSTWSGAWLYSIFFTNVNTGYAAGYNENCNCGDVVRTTNGGALWTEKQYVQYQEGFNSITFVDTTIGFVCSVHGGIARTTDAGATWSDVSINIPSTIRNMSFGDKKTGYAVAYDPNPDQASPYPSYIYKSTDSGSTWQLLQDYSQQAVVISDIKFLTSQIGFFTGYNGQYLIMRTTDGGTIWSPVYNQGGAGVVQSINFQGSAGYAVGDNGVILVSSDTGHTWHSKNYTTTYSILGVTAFDTSDVVAVGQNGLILQSLPPMGVAEPPAPDDLVSLYPNPVQSGSVLRINVPVGIGYSVRVYNILGEEIQHVADFSSSASISASDLPRGTYIYHLLHEQRIINTGKFIVN